MHFLADTLKQRIDLGRLLMPVYTATIFLSAFLLFSVQPMFTKMVTPVLGGTPAVWSIAVVFFQGILLCGYAYAHGLARYLSPTVAASVHLGLGVVVALLALPIAFDPAWGRPPASGEALWLVTVFAASVGLPFFAVSANGPLLQAWFARTSHPQARDPYFLYGASNLASFAALMAYPFLIEPMLALGGQSRLWSFGFVALVIGLAASAALMLATSAASSTVSASSVAAPSTPITTHQRLSWIAYAFVPSALLVAVTAHLSTDIAAVPLLWILPLALFLLTFVVAFNDRYARLLALMRPTLPALAGFLLLAGMNIMPMGVAVALNLGFLFVATTLCHLELYKRRPAASDLSAFYFMMSLGGVLGGIFSSLLAPALFNSILEYPILIIAVLACQPNVRDGLREIGMQRLVLSVAVAAAALAVVSWTSLGDMLINGVVAAIMLSFLAIILLSREAPARVMLLTALGLLSIEVFKTGRGTIVQERSFFAVHTVRSAHEGRAHLLVHGTTMHGAEWVRDETGKPLTTRPTPASYFHANGVYQQAISATRAAAGGSLKRVAVIGLGMGSLACASKPGEEWVFFEIDDVVVRMARDPALFRSLSVCTPGAEVVLGDGRLTLADAAGKFDLIILDAFSSDSVPVHLLTTEAMAAYKSKLTPGGGIIFNISNRHMALDAVIAGGAHATGLEAVHRRDGPLGPADDTLSSRAHVAIVSMPKSQILDSLRDKAWHTAVPEGAAWTDDFSNILAPILRKSREQ
jgi:spermidine synthase